MEEHDEEHGDEHNEHHDEWGTDAIVVTILDVIVVASCIIIFIHFMKHIYTTDCKKGNANRSFSDLRVSGLFKTADIICFITILFYSISILCLVVHDILHFIEQNGLIEASFHYELETVEWIIYICSPISLQLSYLLRLYLSFYGSALQYNRNVYISLFVCILLVFIYGIIIIILRNHYYWHFSLTFVFWNLMIIFCIACLLIRKLYKIVYEKIKLQSISSATSMSNIETQTTSNESHSNPNPKPNRRMERAMSNADITKQIHFAHKDIVDALAKYSLLATIITIGIIIHFIVLVFVKQIFQSHDDESDLEHQESLRHSISAVAIFIESLCVYLSCQFVTKYYKIFCKYPHKCFQKCCMKVVNYKIQKNVTIQLAKYNVGDNIDNKTDGNNSDKSNNIETVEP